MKKKKLNLFIFCLVVIVGGLYAIYIIPYDDVITKEPTVRYITTTTTLPPIEYCEACGKSTCDIANHCECELCTRDVLQIQLFYTSKLDSWSVTTTTNFDTHVAYGETERELVSYINETKNCDDFLYTVRFNDEDGAYMSNKDDALALVSIYCR